jgi:hypothetical protein
MPSPHTHAPYSRHRRWRVPEARAALDALAASGLLQGLWRSEGFGRHAESDSGQRAITEARRRSLT